MNKWWWFLVGMFLLLASCGCSTSRNMQDMTGTQLERELGESIYNEENSRRLEEMECEPEVEEAGICESM